MSFFFLLSGVLWTARWLRGNAYVETADRQTDIASGVILEEQIYVCRDDCRHLVFLNVCVPAASDEAFLFLQ